MADDKKGRDKQARDAEKRQRKREIAAELERGDEPEPPIDPADLADFERALESLEFPVTGAEVVAAVGDHELESPAEVYTVDELVPDAGAETFDSPAEVRTRVQRPTIAAAMKRVVEASDTLPNATLAGSRKNGYEKTFRELKAVDADDDDEGIPAIRDWIVAYIDDKGKLPGSRAVRREAAKFCRQNGYQVRNSEWLGI